MQGPGEAVVDQQEQGREASRKAAFPPGPRWPRAVQTAWWAPRPVSLLDRCRRRYGDVFRLRPYGHGDIVCIADPELIRAVEVMTFMVEPGATLAVSA